MRKLILYILLFFCQSSFAAQYRHWISDGEDSVLVKTTVEMYCDSLALYRQRLDSLEQLNEALIADGSRRLSYDADSRYMRLFSTVAYHSDIIGRRFAITPYGGFDDAFTTIDDALMNIYLYHPDMVSNILRENAEKHEVNVDPQKKIEVAVTQTNVDMPKAEEIDFDAVRLVVTKPNFWKFSGDYYLQFMQNGFSKNWYQGGESNYSVLGRVTLQANYNNKQRVKVENKLEMHLGFQTSSSDEVHHVKTSSDLLRYTGKFGLQASKKWYYTLQIVANSQFMRSFAPNSNNVNSDFLSPAAVNVSLGMDYTIGWFKNKMTGSVHLAPLALNYKYCDRDNLVTRHGIEEGKHHITDYGSTFTLDFRWKFSNNVNWKSRLYGYTTYERVDLQWENTLDLKISKLITMSIYLYPRFDDSNIKRKDRDLGYFQYKEYTSFGFTYNM